MIDQDLLEAHLSVSWLRPENVAIDTMASMLIREHEFKSPIVEVGCGNGIFSFITAGGKFDEDYDWFVNTDTRQTDIYDTKAPIAPSRIIKPANYTFYRAVERKKSLLDQADYLGLYDHLIQADANESWPFPTNGAQTIFSNMLYWLSDPKFVYSEISRVLAPGGKAYLCLPDERFISGRSYEQSTPWQRLLNGSRRDNIKWTADPHLAGADGLRLLSAKSYMKKTALEYWDIGMRPVLSPLIKMAYRMTPTDRIYLKREWMYAAGPYVSALLEEEISDKSDGAFWFYEIEKR